jgi:two-component system, cell cycle sensor histidine kinase and response regulator CckA
VCARFGPQPVSCAIFSDDKTPPGPPRRAAEPNDTADTALVDSAQDAIIAFDSNERIVFWNRGAQAFYGWSRREALGVGGNVLLQPKPVADFATVTESGRADWDGLVRHATRDRGEVMVWSRRTTIRDGDGEVRSTLQVDRDVAWLTRIVDATLDGVVVTDGDQRIVLLNAAAARLFGASAPEVVGKPIDTLLPWGELQDRLRTDRAAAPPKEFPPDAPRRFREIIARRSDGTELPIEVTISRIAIGTRSLAIAICRDVTERRTLEEQFRQSQRMESIGRLAAGIAHDFNNLLSAISGFLELARPGVTDADAIADLDEARLAADRAARLTRQLLIFTRNPVTRPRLVSPNDSVAAVTTLLRRAIGEDVRLETALDASVPQVRADPAQLEQALLNLAINARDAMPNGGTLTITTRLGAIQVAGGERRAAVIEVVDTGTGMDERTRARAFEPFFTTKDPSRGTGLGLPAVQGVAIAAGGTVSIDSAPGAGTRVVITLPVAEDDELDADVSPGWDATSPPAGRGRLLLVEDEDAVRGLARRLLRRQGHMVIEARTGEDALARWSEAQSRGEHIDAVVTDVVMPDMGGRELVARLRELSPRLPVVYMSGYVVDAAAALDLSEPAYVLEKPFTGASLNAAVDAVLAPQ